MNSLHSQRKEHSKTEFEKKNSKILFGESETFYQSKFSLATGVTYINDWVGQKFFEVKLEAVFRVL